MFASPCPRQNQREHLVRVLGVAEGQHADFTVSADYTVVSFGKQLQTIRPRP